MKRKSNKYERLWVSDDFRRVIKSEAALRGKDVVSYTEDLSKEYWERKKKEGFKFGF